MRTRRRWVAILAVAALCTGLAQDAFAQKAPGRGPGVRTPTPSMPAGGGGGGRGPNWGGVGAGIAAGVVGGLILQGIANANANASREVYVDDGPPPRRAPRSTAPSSRTSGAPPAGETRFLPNEIVTEVPATMPAQALLGLERRHRLSRLESYRSTLSGTTRLRWRIADGRPVPTLIRALEREGMVATAQPNYIYTLQQDAQPIQLPPQYAPARMRLPQAHAIARGTGVRIAVIDSGIDAGHPELAGAVADSFNAASSPFSPHAHGTGIAGLIAARGRMTGAAPDAAVIAIRAFEPDNASAQGTTFAILKGLDHAAASTARIVNMSFAGPADPAIAKALATAARRGMILIAAAGNDGPDSRPLYPAADPNVIAVSATGEDDTLFARSNTGRHIALAAPGVDILAPGLSGGYQVSSGTSMAAAEVSGIVALLLQRKPGLTPAMVRRILAASAEDLGPQGRDDRFGAGLANAEAALAALDGQPVPKPALAGR